MIPTDELEKPFRVNDIVRFVAGGPQMLVIDIGELKLWAFFDFRGCRCVLRKSRLVRIILLRVMRLEAQPYGERRPYAKRADQQHQGDAAADPDAARQVGYILHYLLRC